MNQHITSALVGRMLEEGRISPALAHAAIERNSDLGERVEESLLECGLPEGALLRHLAEMFQTKFISTKTLRSIVAPPRALNRLPQRLAEDYQTVPIRFADDETVTVITADAGDPELLERVRVASGASSVTALVARPAAVRAAIAKFYRGEANAFDELSADSFLPSSAPPAAASPDAPEAGTAPPPPSTEANLPPAGPPALPARFANPQGAASEEEAPQSASPQDEVPSPTQLGGDAPAPRQVKPARPSLPAPPASSAPPPAFTSGATVPTVPPISQPYAAPPTPPASFASSVPPASPLDAARARALGNAAGLTEALIVIAERTRGSLKGHSVRVSRLAHALCRELNLGEDQAAEAWAAGLLHDLGKAQPFHLTALNVWQLRDHEKAARSQYGNPARILKNAGVQPSVIAAILHMYERYDGRGFPEGLAEESIPYLGRILALCDTVVDLTMNPNNSLGRIVSPIEACNHIKSQTPRVFDPSLVAHFSRLLVDKRLDEVFANERSTAGIEKLLA